MGIRIEKQIRDTTGEDRKGTPNDEYEIFVNAHLEATANCIPTKPRTKYRVPRETLAVRENVQTWKLPPNVIWSTQQTQML